MIEHEFYLLRMRFRPPTRARKKVFARAVVYKRDARVILHYTVLYRPDKLNFSKLKMKLLVIACLVAACYAEIPETFSSKVSGPGLR